MPRIEHVHINISQNNQVRAHLLAKHRELSGESSAEKFVNPDGELRLRSDDKDKAVDKIEKQCRCRCHSE